MNIERMSYRKAVKKQLGYCFACVAIWCVGGYVLYPVNSWDKQLMFAVLSVFLGFSAFSLVRRASKLVLCRNCQSNLYEIISQFGEESRLEINFCPVCGENLKS